MASGIEAARIDTHKPIGTTGSRSPEAAWHVEESVKPWAAASQRGPADPPLGKQRPWC